nr:lactate racemase domain-containing protein [Candidatus Sigynarchaeum springense]
MAKEIAIPWGAWTGGKEATDLEFPDSWDVQVFRMRDAPDITDKATIQRAIRNPIGSPPIKSIAAGKPNAVIAVEDISRPIQCKDICETIIGELNEAGIPDGRITLIGALGAHRPMIRADYIKKVGENVVDRINVENHHPYENLVNIGTSKKGTPIFINKTYHDAAVKIAVGTVAPHPLAGFGGGAKVILPGICGIDTLEANHKAGLRGIGIGLGFITDLRKDIEDVCSKAGLDFSVNVVTTSRRGIAGVHAGHFIDAHRKAVEQALQVYHTDIPKLPPKDRFSAGFFNMYPEDTELSQASGKGTNAFIGAQSLFQRKAAVIIMTAAPEGRGFHSLQGETGGRLYQNFGDNILYKAVMESHPLYIYSQNVSKADVHHFFPERTTLHKEFNRLVEGVENIVGPSPKVALFPASIQLF